MLSDQRRPPLDKPVLFHTIDGMRGIGVMAVVLFHLPDHRVHQLIPGAYLVVDLFYVISGFVLSHAYQSRLGRDLDGAGFMRLRMIRIYPLYALALLLAVIANLLIIAKSGFGEPWIFLASVVTSAFILPTIQPLAYRHHHPYPFNGATWTLFWELLVNAVWAMLGPRLGDRLLFVFVAVGLMLLVVAVAVPRGMEGGGAFSTFFVGGLRVGFDFFAGVAAYRIWSRGKLAWLRIPAWASALVMIAIFMLRPLHDNSGFDLIAVLAMPLLVIASTDAPPPRLTPICKFSGEIAYGAYILNFPVLLTLSQTLQLFGLSVGALGIIGVFLFMVLVIMIAFVTARFFDPPMRRWLSRRFASDIGRSGSKVSVLK